MAPHYGHGARRTAHHITHAHGGAPRHTSSANSTQLGHQGHRTMTRRDGDGARETQSRRERQKRRYETVIPRSPSPAVPLNRPTRLVDRMTYDHRDEVQGPIDRGGGDASSPRFQQGRRVQDRVARDCGSRGDGGPVQPASLRRKHRDRTTHNNTNSPSNDIDEDEKIDNSYSIFITDPPSSPSASTPRTTWQPTNIKPVQYGSSHHLPFNLHLHPSRPVQPATRPEPIRLLNSWTPQEPATNTSSATKPSAPEPSPTTTSKAPAKPKLPVNTYKGNDVVKRRVRNKRLQLVLSDKPMPKKRKAADRMVLRCSGRQEFR
ncbi:hypothetical protein EKO04_001374 [Ascochyta lentis]|uniref:Uncharacterized protein n=1 Tax=Ascochyta lentis TaxID=205686 RepID=A0A8H7JDB3_9PLEO|nr:hypothetical protein EKO04_001374 [Ascochyta lentis]